MPPPPSTAWRRFALLLAAVVLGGSACLFALLALLDPWGMLPVASPLPRRPADHSQRWAYPELARDPRFDAIIIGDSTTRLLDPAKLDPAAHAHFANLAMLRATAYEQSRLLDVFLQAHPDPAAILVGIDRFWCETGTRPIQFGYDPIPEWLYDGDRGAALLHLFNLHAIETAWRSLTAELGRAPPPYGRNGYALIDVDQHPYDPALAAHLIADGLREPWPAPPGPDSAKWPIEALDWLTQRIAKAPASARIALVFVPRYHASPAPSSDGAAMMDECKRRIVALARARPNTEVYDFTIPSPVTTEPHRWWDAVHARPETMAEVSIALAQAMQGHPSPIVRTLVPPLTHSTASAQ